jgi:hypothetical protein
VSLQTNHALLILSIVVVCFLLLPDVYKRVGNDFQDHCLLELPFFFQLISPANEGNLSAGRTLISGGMAGATSAVTTYPLDLVICGLFLSLCHRDLPTVQVRSFLSVQTSTKQYSGIVGTMKVIVQSEGELLSYPCSAHLFSLVVVIQAC